MNKYNRILKSFNYTGLSISLFFAIFLTAFVDYSNYFWIFIVSTFIYAFNAWLINQGRYQIAYLIFMFTNCGLLLLFDAGIHGPTHSYVFYIPLLLSNFIIIKPEKLFIRFLAFFITFCCIITTTYFNFTPKLSLLLFKPEHQELVIYVNFISVLLMTLIMMEIILRNSNKAETALIAEQQNLLNKEQLLHSINQNISEGIYRSTENNNLVYMNKAFVQLFGYESMEEVLKLKSPFLYHDPSERDKLVQLIKAQGYFTNQEVLFIKKDGSTFWGLISSILSVDNQGNQYYDGAIRDITQFKRIEEEMLQAKNQAEQASLAKSKFLSAMSHEIRTPMNAVIGITNLLMMNENRAHLEKENLNVLKSSAQNLMSLLNDLLDFSKIEAGKFDLNPVFSDLKNSLNDLIYMYQFHARQKGIEFLHDIRLNEVEYYIDQVRIMQVLSNLLSNAIKFTHQGYVKLIVYCEPQEQQQTLIHFSVTDTGIGIDLNQQKSIFNAFTQENENIAVEYGGSGLGLAISRTILEKNEQFIPACV